MLKKNNNCDCSSKKEWISWKCYYSQATKIICESQLSSKIAKKPTGHQQNEKHWKSCFRNLYDRMTPSSRHLFGNPQSGISLQKIHILCSHDGLFNTRCNASPTHISPIASDQLDLGYCTRADVAEWWFLLICIDDFNLSSIERSQVVSYK